MNYGTIFECKGGVAVRHRIPQAEWLTVCGINLYNKIPDEWGDLLKRGWHVEHALPKEERCKKCYPHHRSWKNHKKRRKSWA